MSENNNTKTINSVTIWDEHRNDDHYIFTAEIKKNGDLVLGGQDIGPSVLEWFGGRDNDYEYWFTFKQEWKDTLLLHLLAEKFTLENPPKAWLDEKGIAYDFSNWV